MLATPNNEAEALLIKKEKDEIMRMKRQFAKELKVLIEAEIQKQQLEK